jgi:asparagine synthetase B (glutamine-hydrolysing)
VNGFIFVEAGAQSSASYRAAASRDAHLSFREETFATGDRLLAWGYPEGDIHYSRKTEKALIVLCGYISGIDGGPEIADQEQAVDFLQRCMAEEFSTARLTALLNRTHGSFAIFHRDYQRGLSVCLSDRVASRPLWKMWAGGGWIVSSHPMAIAASVPSREIDLGALGAFLLYGSPVQPRKSLFKGITAIGPGSIVRLRGAGVAEGALWHRYLHRPEKHRTMTEWVDFTSDRLVRSASRLARHCHRPAVFFSGGVDSRLTAAALKAAGEPP